MANKKDNGKLNVMAFARGSGTINDTTYRDSRFDEERLRILVQQIICGRQNIQQLSTNLLAQDTLTMDDYVQQMMTAIGQALSVGNSMIRSSVWQNLPKDVKNVTVYRASTYYDPLDRDQNLSKSRAMVERSGVTSQKFVDWGRLNRPHESLLYCSFDPNTAKAECRITEEQPYLLFTYKIIEPVRLVLVSGERFSQNVFSLESKQLGAEMNSFLNQWFGMEADRLGNRKSWIYAFTNKLAKKYFCLEDNQDGWAYPSVKMRHANFGVEAIEANRDKFRLETNLALRPSVAQSSLRCVDVYMHGSFR